ncbi:hypothetical protein C1646_773063 [Rhizophagus diaphanus]|nr:hypothetical protein C1646_773063 [Rhizophagus diaphanus] [Rhizophagus sp. MUCL 43196]
MGKYYQFNKFWTTDLEGIPVRWFPASWTLQERKQREKFQAVIHDILAEITIATLKEKTYFENWETTLRVLDTPQVFLLEGEELKWYRHSIPNLKKAQQKPKAKNTLNVKKSETQSSEEDKESLKEQRCKKSRAKKARLLQEYQEVILYDSPGRPPFLTQYPNLIEHIHEYIEFRAADKKRRKEIIKVRTICHLQEDINSKYNEYLSRTTLNNYLLPSWSNTKAAKLHHHPAIVANASQKFIPSVYLLINPSDTNDTFCNGQLSIFIRPQYQIGTSSATHIIDLNSLTQDGRFDEILKIDGHIKPIWIILVDESHIPGQSAYNPVERSMATLIDKYSSHLNSQG